MTDIILVCTLTFRINIIVRALMIVYCKVKNVMLIFIKDVLEDLIMLKQDYNFTQYISQSERKIKCFENISL